MSSAPVDFTPRLEVLWPAGAYARHSVAVWQPVFGVVLRRVDIVKQAGEIAVQFIVGADTIYAQGRGGSIVVLVPLGDVDEAFDSRLRVFPTSTERSTLVRVHRDDLAPLLVAIDSALEILPL